MVHTLPSAPNTLNLMSEPSFIQTYQMKIFRNCNVLILFFNWKQPVQILWGLYAFSSTYLPRIFLIIQCSVTHNILFFHLLPLWYMTSKVFSCISLTLLLKSQYVKVLLCRIILHNGLDIAKGCIETKYLQFFRTL